MEGEDVKLSFVLPSHRRKPSKEQAFLGQALPDSTAPIHAGNCMEHPLLAVCQGPLGLLPF
jgi:hypothetical protein